MLGAFAISFFIVTHSLATPKLHLYTENFAPYNYLDENGIVTGIATETIKALMDKAGLEYNINVYPWARAYKVARTEAYSGIFSIMHSKQRDPHFRWVCPIARQESLYFVRLARRNDIILNNIEDAKKYITSVNRDEFAHQLLIKHQFEQRKHYRLGTGSGINLKLLLDGYTDLIIATPTTISEEMALHTDNAPQVVMELSLSSDSDNPLCLAFGLKTPQSIVDKLQQTLDELNNLNSG